MGRHIPRWLSHRRTPRWTCTPSAKSLRRPACRPRVSRHSSFRASRVQSRAAAGFFALDDAVAAVRALRADGGRSAAMLFDKPEFAHTSAKLPVAAASAVHAGIAATLILISTIGLPQAAETPVRLEPVRPGSSSSRRPGPAAAVAAAACARKRRRPRAERKARRRSTARCR